MPKEDKVLSDVIAQITKKYGEGTLVDLGAAETHRNVETFTTGLPSLDLILGGGIPRGRIIEVYGPESSGKSTLALHILSKSQLEGKKVAYIDAENCVHGGSELFNPLTGELRTIQEITEQTEAYSVESFDEKTSRFVPGKVVGRKIGKDFVEGFLVRTKLGKDITVTPEHKVFTYGRGWVEAKHLTMDDHIATEREFAYFGDQSRENEACLMGYMVGDGYLPSKGSLQFTVADKDIYSHFKSIVNSFGSDLKPAGNNGLNFRVVEGTRGGLTAETRIQQMCSGWNLRGKKSFSKVLPEEVFASWNKASVSKLLRSLWLTDGSVNPVRSTLDYATSSRVLAKQVQHLLRRFGIVSQLQTSQDKRQSRYRTMYRVLVNGRTNAQKFLAEIGLLGRKQNALETLLKKCKKFKPCYGELLPGYKNGRSYKHREEFLNKSSILWDKIVGIQETQLIPYDLTIEKYHCFMANDLLVHNCFDPEYAEKMGVDPKNMFLNQPDSGEQALDIVEKLCQSGKISVIVVDSVACLVPMAVSAKEIDGSMNIATTARLLSQTLPRIGNAARASNTTIIFINQIRMKIGEMYGNPEITPGGMALKFCASLRLDVRGRPRKTTDDTEAQGLDVTIRVKKNKIAPPFRHTQLFLEYGKGFDAIADLLDTGIGLGIIEKSGGWFQYGGLKVQGWDKFTAQVRADQTLLDEILSKIREVKT